MGHYSILATILDEFGNHAHEVYENNHPDDSKKESFSLQKNNGLVSCAEKLECGI